MPSAFSSPPNASATPKWFIAKATAYAGERVVFGRPIGQNQGVQFPIARAYINMRAAELMVREAGGALRSRQRLRRRGQHGEAPRRGIVLGRRRHVRADAWRLRLAEEFDIERKFRETRLYTVAPISTNLVLSYIAEHVLGLPRSY